MGAAETPILKAALEYLAQGRSIIPLVKKRPVVKWKDLQSRRPSEDEVRKWFSGRGVQIAMIMGRVSGNIWVLDADGPAAVDWMMENAPATTVYVHTKRGRHAYFRMPPGAEVRSGANVIPEIKASTMSDQIDVKGEGGYAVVPPSAFTGGEYLWDIRGAGWAGLAVWQPPAQKNMPPLSSGNGNLNLDLTGIKVFGECRPVTLGERNSTLASVAGSMIARGLSPEEVMVWAAGWNLQNSPPLPDEEVARTIESIAGGHLRNHGSIPAPPIIIDFPAQPEAKREVDIPTNILKPGGVIEMVMDYIEKSTVASFPLFSMAAALTLIGTLIGQKVMTETGLRTNLYIFALAPSGTGKNAPISAVKKLMFEANCNEDHLGPSHLASSAALISELSSTGRQSLLLLFDEIGDLIGSVKNKNNVAKNETIQLLKELHSCTDGVYSKSYAESNRNLMVHRPHLSLYATGVPSKFWSNFSFGEVSDGFLPRALVFSVDLEIKKKKKILLSEPPVDLTEALKAIAQIEKQHAGNLSTTPVPQPIPKTPEAEVFFDQWDDQLLILQNKARNADGGQGEIYNRAAEQAHKIALIHAVSLAGGLPESVGLESVKFAIDLVDWAIPQMIRHIAENVSSGELDGLRKRILSLVEKRGPASKRDLYRNLHGCTPRMTEEALKILEETGELIPAQVTQKNGRVSLVWMRPKDKEEND